MGEDVMQSVQHHLKPVRSLAPLVLWVVAVIAWGLLAAVAHIKA